ncbi:MAG: hypothetical protein LBO66_12255 [Deltaproteobacteria bacterium]|nr:hypothetical protein [Deltaproteobacteria bacterium]
MKLRELSEAFKPKAVSVRGEAERARLLALPLKGGERRRPEFFIGPNGVEMAARASLEGAGRSPRH